MSVHTQAEGMGVGVPELDFAVTGCAHRAFAATPTMVFSMSASEHGGREIQSMMLSVLVMIDPAKRGYDQPTRARLTELFGPPASWTPSTQGLAWARVAAVVPAFLGEAIFTLEVPCSYDLEVAATKYFYAVPDGEVPLSFHYNGTIFYRGDQGQLQVVPVPWSATASFKMPLARWREMISEHYPGGAWIRLHESTLAAFNERRADRGLPSFDACLQELLGEERDDAR